MELQLKYRALLLQQKEKHKIYTLPVCFICSDTGLGIPVVLVVVEGGYDAIEDCRKSLSQKIPVIICEGTGRAADIIAYAYSHFITTRK